MPPKKADKPVEAVVPVVKKNTGTIIKKRIITGLQLKEQRP
jgi:hypothetical protein